MDIFNIIDQYLKDIQSTIDHIPVDRIQEVINILQEARLNRKQVFIMGNGGSASTASHFVCDLAKNTRKAGSLMTQDRVTGVLTLTRLQSNRFTMEDLSLLTSITLALSYSFTAKSPIKVQR